MSINLTLIAQALTFAIFIGFTARFVWPHVLRAVDARQQQIAEGLAAAERGKVELQQADARTAEILRDARERAQAFLGESERRAARIVEDARAAGHEEAARLVAAARSQIEQEAASAREALRAQVADLALALAEQILEREIDSKGHAELLASVRSRL